MGLDHHCFPTVVHAIQPLDNPVREGGFPTHIPEASRPCSSCPAPTHPFPGPIASGPGTSQQSELTHTHSHTQSHSHITHTYIHNHTHITHRLILTHSHAHHSQTYTHTITHSHIIHTHTYCHTHTHTHIHSSYSHTHSQEPFLSSPPPSCLLGLPNGSPLTSWQTVLSHLHQLWPSATPSAWLREAPMPLIPNLAVQHPPPLGRGQHLQSVAMVPSSFMFRLREHLPVHPGAVQCGGVGILRVVCSKEKGPPRVILTSLPPLLPRVTLSFSGEEALSQTPVPCWGTSSLSPLQPPPPGYTLRPPFSLPLWPPCLLLQSLHGDLPALPPTSNSPTDPKLTSSVCTWTAGLSGRNDHGGRPTGLPSP